MTEPNANDRVSSIYSRAGDRLNAIRAQIIDLTAEVETIVQTLDADFDKPDRPWWWADAIRSALVDDGDEDGMGLAELPEHLYRIGRQAAAAKASAAEEQPA